MKPVDISAEIQQAKSRFGIVGNAPALTAAIQRAIRVAPIDLSVLITGESGTGKEFFPQIIHQYGARKHSKYIAVNCGAIPEGTIDSELFGHEKGAFTGAVASRKGYFEEADGGTIFLDEVAELPLTTQARLLRVLESGEFIKVGSSTVQRTNIRVVAATNVDMLKAVESGKFREDLYYRLSTIHLNVPPLRERGNDILLLARKFAADFAERYRMPAIEFDPEASEMLLRFPWPGNVRQLKNVVEQVALFDAGNTVGARELSQYLPAGAGIYTPTIAESGIHSYSAEREVLFNMIFRMREEIDSLRASISAMSRQSQTAPAYEQAQPVMEMPGTLVKYSPMESVFNPVASSRVMPIDAEDSGMTLEATERETIKRALERNEGRRKATATELNISERTLYRKIKEYGLE